MNPQDLVPVAQKINEIVRFLNALNVSVDLLGSGNKHDVGFEHDNDLMERFGEWIPKDFVR